MSLRTAICNLRCRAQLRAATKQTRFESSEKGEFNQSAKKVSTNDSIGTFSPGLYILYLLKLPAPPRAELSGIYSVHVKRGVANQPCV